MSKTEHLASKPRARSAQGWGQPETANTTKHQYHCHVQPLQTKGGHNIYLSLAPYCPWENQGRLLIKGKGGGG